MDPNATLSALIDAATSGRANEVQELGDALAAWLRRGGFPPVLVVDGYAVPEDSGLTFFYPLEVLDMSHGEPEEGVRAKLVLSAPLPE